MLLREWFGVGITSVRVNALGSLELVSTPENLPLRHILCRDLQLIDDISRHPHSVLDEARTQELGFMSFHLC